MLSVIDGLNSSLTLRSIECEFTYKFTD